MGCGASISLGEAAFAKFDETLEARHRAEECRRYYDEEFDRAFKRTLLSKLCIASASSIASLQEVNLSAQLIGQNTTLARNAAMLLNLAPFVKKVNLSNTGMDGVSFVSFVNQLEHHHNISEMDLHGNSFDKRSDEQQVGVCLASLIGKLPACQGTGKLWIQSCGLSGLHIQAFAEVTKVGDWRPGHLPEVFFAGNVFGSGKKIGHALAHLLNLCPESNSISIARCGLDVNALTALAQEFNDHDAVDEIDLLNNKFGGGPTAGEAVGTLMSKCVTVRKFFLYRCGFDGEALESMADVMEPNNYLEMIDMSNDELFYRSNDFQGEAAGRGLAKILAKCPAVTTLDVRHTGFDMDSAGALLKAGEMNYSVEKFKCFDSGLSTSYFYELAERLQEHFVVATFS
jgi:hypothetical protein